MSEEGRSILDEITENVRRDRKRLELVAEKLVSVLKDEGDDEEHPRDPLAAVGLAENVAKISDALTRSNGLLVELAKMKSKESIAKKMVKGGFSFDEDERDDILAEIQVPGDVDSRGQ